MQKLSKLLLFLTVAFSLFIVNYSLLITRADAQVPNPWIPCGESNENPEFNSLRPYQASPCGDAPKVYYCGNEILIYEIAQHTLNSTNSDICSIDEYEVNKVVDKTYDIALKDLELPILGNTQDVKNSQNAATGFDDATKVNEYVSWYLSGANAKAETGTSTDDQIVNYSGPVQKLLPSVIQDFQRIKTIESVTKTVTYSDTEAVVGGAPPKKVENEPENHDQIVVCADKNIFGVFGQAVPQECYKGDNSPAQDEYRLTDWENSLSMARTISNNARDFFGNIPVIGNLLSTVSTNAWNKRIPPLPWDNGDGQPFPSDLAYQKAYNEWKGKSCLIIPIINKLLCFDNPGVTNEYADLYQYVPLSNTSDKKSLIWVPRTEVKPIMGTDIEFSNEDIKYIVEEEVLLFYPHTMEDAQLSGSLQTTFVPKTGTSEDIEPLTTEPDTDEVGQCRLLNVRTNEGDDLFPEVQPDSFRVKVNPYTINKIPCNGACTETKNKFGQTVYSKKCEGGATVNIVTQTKLPYVEEIYKNTVAAADSILRKIFPKVEPGAPISCIANIPTYSNATYEILEGTDEIQVAEPDGRKTDGTDSKLYFPYIGSIYEYFLKGIQTALRPQGYGEQIINGEYCTSLNEEAGDCSFSVSKANAAAQKAAAKYKVPAELLKAIFEIESYEWIHGKPYVCEENFAGAAGVAQIVKSTYDTVVCGDEKMANDIGMCGDYGNKLSRCNMDDAFELMARILLFKSGRLSQCRPTSGISLSEKIVWYDAACNYYGTHAADNLTIGLQNDIPAASRRQDGDMNYCDIVCNKMGQCSGSNYPPNNTSPGPANVNPSIPR